MPNSPLNAADYLTRLIETKQHRFTQEAERLAEQAARLAANPPTAGNTTASGEVTRLIAEATSLLKCAVTLEANLEALGLMGAETTTTEQTMSTADGLRARAAELENRVKPVIAGPRTDDEHMWLEKAAALRAEADKLDAGKK